ncbi:hypothetical protein Acr_29g0001090 [Actinidia rufa]|uniref:Reverse transcriptase domain-containing protein n=1 Tax=Actinidia rufa TaxID=165716 RepID=A0A7J0HCU2_9ERIC|nr:hypothetical protein Acr_29g0001090 [Actinidia rufa]
MSKSSQSSSRSCTSSKIALLGIKRRCQTTRYVQWLSNIVLVTKKYGKIQVCIDFKNLNLATSKDEYPMPNVDMLVDGAARHKHNLPRTNVDMLVDGAARHKHNLPRNDSATYQRAMNIIFHGMIGCFMEVYIDDVVIKSQSYEERLEDLKKSFQRMRQFDLKMKPIKRALGVLASNFLRILVQQRGIEVDKNKARAIMKAKPFTTKKEL